jgi:nucleotide-binding universal stress UspA family protein
VSGAVVVGVDGSEHADRALAWAVEEARLRGARLRVVTAWQVPAAVYGPSGFVPPVSGSIDDEFRQVAQESADEAARRAREAGIEVETDVREGDAANALVDAAAGADLLVVGSRGRGALAGAVLGSVSAHCAHHAACPVAIVR